MQLRDLNHLKPYDRYWRRIGDKASLVSVVEQVRDAWLISHLQHDSRSYCHPGWDDAMNNVIKSESKHEHILGGALDTSKVVPLNERHIARGESSTPNGQSSNDGCSQHGICNPSACTTEVGCEQTLEEDTGFEGERCPSYSRSKPSRQSSGVSSSGEPYPFLRVLGVAATCDPSSKLACVALVCEWIGIGSLSDLLEGKTGILRASQEDLLRWTRQVAQGLVLANEADGDTSSDQLQMISTRNIYLFPRCSGVESAAALDAQQLDAKVGP